jgi:hypothetical protein
MTVSVDEDIEKSSISFMKRAAIYLTNSSPGFKQDWNYAANPAGSGRS